MPSGFIYRSGPYEFKDRPGTNASAIARGDSLKATSGKVLPQTTGAKCEGVSQTAKSASADGTIQVLKCESLRTLFQAYEKRASGSLAATDQGSRCDMSGTTGAMGFDSSGTDDGTADIYIDTVLATGAANTGKALIAFADPAPNAY